MKLNDDDVTSLREIRNGLAVLLIGASCVSVAGGIFYLVTVVPPSIRALQEDVAPLSPRITAIERELNEHRIDLERLKAIIKLKHP